MIEAVDLFCGAGGLTHGLEKAGVLVKMGVDVDPRCEYPYSANNAAEFLLRSIEEMNSDELVSAFSEKGLKLLAGCAPCQTFSSYFRNAESDDSRWTLLNQFSRLVEEIKPEFVTMENVPLLERQQIFGNFVRDLKTWGYDVSVRKINCSEYGVPQDRKRLVLLASLFGKIELLEPEEFSSKKLSVREAIGFMPKLKAGESDSKDVVHKSSSLSTRNLKRIKASKPGGTWRDWPKHLISPCHRKPTGKTYPAVYGRMTWDEPSPTITTQFFGFGNGRFGHPDQDRAISLREGALLQSFPIDYKFIQEGEKVSTCSLGKLIGNAVPVTLGTLIGKSLIEHVASHS